MKKHKRRYNFFSEDILVEKMQNGEIGWLEYVNRHSPQWQREYTEFCKEKNLLISEETAEQFVDYKNKQLEEAMFGGDA